MWLNLRKNDFLTINFLFYCFEQKGLFTTNPNFHLDLQLFILVEKKNFLIISELFSEIFFFTKKISFYCNSTNMLQNNRKALFSSIQLILMRKTVFVNNSPILLLCTKRVVYTNPNFPLDLPIFELVEKNKLSKYFWASFWESQFLD